MKLQKACLYTGCLLVCATLNASNIIHVDKIIESNSTVDHSALDNAFKGIILKGKMKPAHIAMAVVIYGKRKGYAEVIRKRINSLSDSSSDTVLKAVALHALAVTTKDDLAEQLIPLLEHHSGKVRLAALDAAQEVECNKELIEVLKNRLIIESALEVKARLLRVLYKFDSENNNKYLKELKSLAESENTIANISAIAMLHEIKKQPVFEANRVALTFSEQRQKDISDTLSGNNINYKKLAGMLMSKSHGQRIQAVRIAATKGTPAIKNFLLNSGKTEILHLRLASAYYLYFQKNKKEALERIKTEKDPMVQTLLLGTLLEDRKGEE